MQVGARETTKLENILVSLWPKLHTKHVCKRDVKPTEGGTGHWQKDLDSRGAQSTPSRRKLPNVQNYISIEGNLKITKYWGRKTPKRK